jgi:hypothetical protein
LQVTENTMLELQKLCKKNKHENRRQKESNNDDRGESSALPQSEGFDHWPELIPLTENCKRAKVFLKCRMCTKNKIVKQTSYRCKGCPNKPPLCPSCFEDWHRNLTNV